MRTYSVGLLAVVLWLSSCQRTSYTIEGTFVGSDLSGQTILLQEWDDRTGKITSVDSLLLANRFFTFSETLSDVPQIRFIHYSPEMDPVLLVAENGTVQLTFDPDLHCKIGGTPLNDSYQAFLDELELLRQEGNRLNEDVFNRLNEQTSDEMLQEIYDSRTVLKERYFNTVYGFIKQNNQNQLGEYLFLHYFKDLKAEQARDILETATPAFKENAVVQMVMRMVGLDRPQ